MSNFKLHNLIPVVVAVLLFNFQSYATVTLPVTFESGSVVNGDFTNFDGGTGTVMANPQIGGINTSATVGRMVRNGGQVWAGAYLTNTSNVDFTTNFIICMKVYTDAPIGTNVSFKMEGCGGGCSREIASATTVTGEWETLYWDFSGEPTNYDRLVLLFDLGNLGNGTSTSTFLFDDIEQKSSIPIPSCLTAIDGTFCPTSTADLAVVDGGGGYNWYDAETGGTRVETNSATFTTPPLSDTAIYYVEDTTGSPITKGPVGPSMSGASNPTLDVSTFFTSNLNNGFLYSVDFIVKVVGGLPATCSYTVTIYNLSKTTQTSVTQSVPGTDNSSNTFTFPAPFPLYDGDSYQLRIVSNSGHPCYCSSHHSGGDVITAFPNTDDPELTFTSHTNSEWTGFNFEVDGDLAVICSRTPVTATISCPAGPCLTAVHDTLCLTPSSTASLAVINGGGTYNWYADSLSSTILTGGTNTVSFTTPSIGTTTSYWVEEGGTTVTDKIIGPTTHAYSVGNPAWWGRQVFTSNFDDGATFNEVTLVNRIAGTLITSCDWEVCVTNLTQDPGHVSESCAYVNNLTANTPGSIGVFDFADVSMDSGDVIEVDFVSLDGAGSGCCVTPIHLSTYTPYPNTSDPEVTWTSHQNGETGTDGNRFVGYNYTFSGTSGGGTCTGEPRTEVIATNGNCPMALDLMDFSIAEVNGNALLKWKMGQDELIEFYEIYRSKDGVHFDYLDRIQGQKMNKEYAFTDYNPLLDQSYYRIEAVSKTDVYESENLPFSLGDLSSIVVFPNPTTGRVMLSDVFKNESTLKIRVLDIAGRELYNSTDLVSIGYFEKEINIETYPIGVYVLELSTQFESKNLKLYKTQ